MKDKKIAIRHVELVHLTPGIRRAIKDTHAIETAAVRWVSDIVMKHWDVFSELDTNGTILYAERLIHHTTEHPNPMYPEFDELFPKLPSYIRRAVIQVAAGAVSSYKTRLAKYEQLRHEEISNGHKFHNKPPVWNYGNMAITMYKGNAYKVNGHTVSIKLYVNHKWTWVTVAMSGRDARCLDKVTPQLFKQHNPSIKRKNHKVYLMVPVEFKQQKFPDTALAKQTVLGVDLGINHGAVCSAVDFSGKVIARHYDPFHRERKAINSIIARIRILQRKSGTGQPMPKIYSKLEGMKYNYVRQLARWIVNQAIADQCYGIVLERLGKMKARGSKKDRIHHWCKCKIRDFIKSIALRYGIRVFFINPRNTSALAYDGTGKVTRDQNDFSKCTFTTGKRYDCDLSASYNIASRYFIRAYMNELSIHTDGSDRLEELKAKVPELSKRTNCTMSTLWKIQKCICKAAA